MYVFKFSTTKFKFWGKNLNYSDLYEEFDSFPYCIDFKLNFFAPKSSIIFHKKIAKIIREMLQLKYYFGVPAMSHFPSWILSKFDSLFLSFFTNSGNWKFIQIEFEIIQTFFQNHLDVFLEFQNRKSKIVSFSKSCFDGNRYLSNRLNCHFWNWFSVPLLRFRFQLFMEQSSSSSAGSF